MVIDTYSGFCKALPKRLWASVMLYEKNAVAADGQRIAQGRRAAVQTD